MRLGFLLYGLLSLLLVTGCGSSDENESQMPREVIDCGVKAIPIANDTQSIVSTIIDGYTDKQSYSENEQIEFFVNASSAFSANIPIYTVNGQLVDYANLNIENQQVQEANAFMNGYQYCRSGYYLPSKKLKAGLYLLANKIPFIYKGSERSPDIVVVYPTNTAAAYEARGGGSLYSGGNLKRNFKVSFLRPMGFSGENTGFFRWIASTQASLGVSIRYVADIDLDDYQNIADAKVLVIVGHSEYWTRLARLNFDKFIDTGHNAIVLSGNTMWWQVRYSQDKKSLICHKSNSRLGTFDTVADTLLQTKNWYLDELQYPILNSLGVEWRYGGYGANGLLGTEISKSAFGGFKIVTPSSPLLANTSLKKGDVLRLSPLNEGDGTPISGLTKEGYPVLDTSRFSPYRIELIGYEYAYVGPTWQSATLPLLPDQVWVPAGSFSTWIVWQKTPKSGYIMNGAMQPGWTTGAVYLTNDQNSENIKKILTNTINIFIKSDDPFSK